MIRRWQRHHTASAHMMAQRCRSPSSRNSARPAAKGARQRVVGEIAKAVDLPIAIGRWGRVTRLAAQAAEFGDVDVADLRRRETVRQAIAIELRVGARARDRAHVDDEIDGRFPQQIDKCFDRPGRMADGEECARASVRVQSRVNSRPSADLRPMMPASQRCAAVPLAPARQF